MTLDPGTPPDPGATPPASATPPPSTTPRRDAMRTSIEPIARRMADLGLTANKLTLIGFGIAAIAAAFAGFQWWLLAGIVGTFGSGFDMFDGAVARVTGTVSKFGAFMDSTFDRWGEAVLYVGIIVGCTKAGFDIGAWLAAIAMGNAFMVSYARARAESLGFSSGRGMAGVGLAPREVRVAILGVGLVGAGLLGGVNAWDPFDGASPAATTGTLVLALSLLLIAVLAAITVVQRILFSQRQAGA
jgi:CDP-diacylglycerol---glycerol-3-phosphate 3-phosphatidyltransferase